MWEYVAKCKDTSVFFRGQMDPQLALARFALQHPEMVSADYMQHVGAVIKLFTGFKDRLQGAVEDEWRVRWEASGDGFVRNRHTGLRPALLHFPGYFQTLKSNARYTRQVLVRRGLLTLPVLGLLGLPNHSTINTTRWGLRHPWHCALPLSLRSCHYCECQSSASFPACSDFAEDITLDAKALTAELQQIAAARAAEQKRIQDHVRDAQQQARARRQRFARGQGGRHEAARGSGMLQHSKMRLLNPKKGSAALGGTGSPAPHRPSRSASAST
jgi:hypothetical protein